MNCDQVRELLGDLVEGTLDAEARRTVDVHLADCAACRTLAADLDRIREEAARLPKVVLPDTLWAKVRSRLEAETAAATLTATPGTPPTSPATIPPAAAFSHWLRSLLATPARAAVFSAAAVVLVALAVAAILYRPAGPALSDTTASRAATATQPAGTDNASQQDLVQSVEMELQLAEQHYENAIAGLERIAKEGEGVLDPQIAAVLQRNLGVIDQAIRESREALRSQPTSQLAQESLFEAFRRKVAMLQDTIALINEMRKGNQAGAASVLQKMGRSS